MKLISQKIPGGKLVKVQYACEHDVITHFKLFGDFFLHPESAIETIEKNVIGVAIDDISTTIDEVLKKTHGEFIGVSADDIQSMIEEDQG